MELHWRGSVCVYVCVCVCACVLNMAACTSHRMCEFPHLLLRCAAVILISVCVCVCVCVRETQAILDKKKKLAAKCLTSLSTAACGYQATSSLTVTQ